MIQETGQGTVPGDDPGNWQSQRTLKKTVVREVFAKIHGNYVNNIATHITVIFLESL